MTPRVRQYAQEAAERHGVTQGDVLSRMRGRDLIHENGRRVGVRLDFIYTEKGRRIAEDSKGKAARDWPLRKAVFRACFPQIELREV